MGELRERFRRVHDIEIGLYSYGCFDRWRIPPGSRIGRYCSFAANVRLVEADHPVGALTTHPVLYQSGLVPLPRLPGQVIEDDVWLSHNSVILPGCRRIGRGAVIGAGAVVTRDVSPYAIVAGVPGRAIRLRFEPEVITAIEATRWWLLDRATLTRGLAAAPDFGTAPSVDGARRFTAALQPAA